MEILGVSGSLLRGNQHLHAEMTARGWLLSLNMQSLNDCCDREQTVKNITGRFPEPQELTQLPWSLVDTCI